MAERANNQRAVARTRKIRARNTRLIRIFCVCLAVVVAFVLGFLARGNATLLHSLGFPQSITGLINADDDPNTQTRDTFNSLSKRVSEVEDILASESLNTYDLEEATAAALGSFAESSGDPYLRYYTQARYESLLNTKGEGYAGVGVLFSEYDGQAYVVDVFEGGPAQLAGVQKGDYVVAVDGDRSQLWSRSEVAAVLSQKEGSSVVITWRRPESLEASGGEEFSTTLDCLEYDKKNVTTEYYEGQQVGYIKVTQLTQNSAALVRQAIIDFEAMGAKAYVLDLRGNPGGYLTQAVDIASLFMSSGTVVSVQTKEGQSVKTATGNPRTNSPLIVLVDRDTAAGAEVIAAALKESQRATIIGNSTRGKGSVQVLHELSFGGAIRYTAAYYMTPNGHSIDGVGVSPDVTIDASVEGDSQKQYAIDAAAAKVEPES